MSDRGRRGEQSERTRLLLLDAGLAVLREDPMERLFEKLEARSIAARAGVTTGAFYHHFDSQDSYVHALLEYALGQDPNPPFAQAIAEYGERVAAGATFLDAVTAASTRMIEFARSDATFVLQMAVWAKAHRDIELSRRLDRMYSQVEAEQAAVYEGVLESLGREMRPPFQINAVACSLMAVFEGLSLRQAVSPDAVPSDRMGTLLLAIMELMTRPIGDPGNAADWLESHAPRWVVAGPLGAAD